MLELDVDSISPVMAGICVWLVEVFVSKSVEVIFEVRAVEV